MKNNIIASIQYFESFFFRGIINFFLKPVVFGCSNLDKLVCIAQNSDLSVVIISNHINAYDPLYIATFLSSHTGKQFYPVWLPAKKRFFDNWLKRKLMLYQGCFPIGIGRDEDSLRSLRVLIDKVRSGETICVFPEGQVSTDGTIGKDLGFVTFIARRSSIIILPVSLSGVLGFKADWRQILMRKCKLQVRFGEPVIVELGGSVDSMALIRQAAECNIK